MLGRKEIDYICKHFYIYDQNWKMYSQFLGEPFLINDCLVYYDGRVLYICGFPFTSNCCNVRSTMNEFRKLHSDCKIDIIDVWGENCDIHGVLEGTSAEVVDFTPKNPKVFDSIIDIIDNNNYERIKTLNAINWCSRNVESEFKVLNKDYISNLKMAESFDEEYPCKAMRVYSDSCCSPLFDFSEISNNISINSLNEYKYPRYNQGIWTYNYFRNIQNSKTNFPPYVSDNNSLIEGKYFVVRFLFNKEFKLETLSLNYNYKS